MVAYATPNGLTCLSGLPCTPHFVSMIHSSFPLTATCNTQALHGPGQGSCKFCQQGSHTDCLAFFHLPTVLSWQRHFLLPSFHVPSHSFFPPPFLPSCPCLPPLHPLSLPSSLPYLSLSILSPFHPFFQGVSRPLFLFSREEFSFSPFGGKWSHFPASSCPCPSAREPPVLPGTFRKHTSKGPPCSVMSCGQYSVVSTGQCVTVDRTRCPVHSVACHTSVERTQMWCPVHGTGRLLSCSEAHQQGPRRHSQCGTGPSDHAQPLHAHAIVPDDEVGMHWLRLHPQSHCMPTSPGHCMQ